MTKRLSVNSESDRLSLAGFSGGKVIDRLRSALGIRTDKDLAIRYGFSGNAATKWRSRDSVPIEIVVSAALDDGLSLDWLLLGREPERFAPLKDRNLGTVELNQPLLETLIAALDGALRIANVELQPERFARLITILYEQYASVEPEREQLASQVRRLLSAVA